MTTAEMASEIFLRILSRLDAPQLQQHCAHVFNEELHAIRAEVKQLTAAFARLKEVRDAVASLEQGRSDVTRAPSLLTSVDDAAALHGKLSDRLKRVRAAVEAHQPPRQRNEKETHIESSKDSANARDCKRKRREDSAKGMRVVKEEAAPRLSDSESDYEDERPLVHSSSPTAKRPRGSEEEAPKKPQPAIESSDAEWQRIVSNVLKAAQRLARRKDPAKLVEFETVGRQARRLVHDLQQYPREQQAMRADSRFRNVFASIARGIRSRIPSLTAQAFVPVVDQLTHVLDLACRDRPELAALLKRYADEFSAIQQLGLSEPAPLADELVRLLSTGKEIAQTPASTRSGRVVAYVQEVSAFLKTRQKGEDPEAWSSLEAVAEVVQLAVAAVCEQKWTPSSAAAFQRLLELLQTLGLESQRFFKATKQSCDDLREYLAPPSARRKKTPQEQAPRSKRPAVERELRGQLKAALAEAHAWERAAFKLRQFDDVAHVLQSAVDHKSPTWNAPNDRDVRDCLSLLSRHVNDIKKPEQRAPRREKIAALEQLLR
ncbi:hypothetical protein ATCC90586_004996 [Pythium insidiosum]|nr:hypothetical protein ATCC90586_004996 [Pythium insidiosum]